MALRWIRDKVEGRILHGNRERGVARVGPRTRYGGRIPDVVVGEEIHEAQLVGIKDTKFDAYARLDNPKTLWLVFRKNPLLAFDHINLLYLTANNTVDYVSVPEIERVKEGYAEKLAAVRTATNHLEEQYQRALDDKRKWKTRLTEVAKEIAELRSLVRDGGITKGRYRDEIDRSPKYLEYSTPRGFVSLKITDDQFWKVQNMLLGESVSVEDW